MKSLMAGKQQPMDNLAALAKAGMPVLHDCGALDAWLDKQTRVVEKRYTDRSRLSSGRAKDTFRCRRKTPSRS